MTQQSHYWAQTLRKSIIPKDTCTTKFTATLFTIARTWKQANVHRQMSGSRRCGTYTVGYYSAIKRNEIRSFVETGMNLQSVIQCEIIQKEKNKYILIHVCGI